jgi:hypothetical protein
MMGCVREVRGEFQWEPAGERPAPNVVTGKLPKAMRGPFRVGSHVLFGAAGVREIVSVPAKRPIKPVYIKQFLPLIDAAKGVRENEHEEESNY